MVHKYSILVSNIIWNFLKEFIWKRFLFFVKHRLCIILRNCFTIFLTFTGRAREFDDLDRRLVVLRVLKLLFHVQIRWCLKNLNICRQSMAMHIVVCRLFC